MERKGAMSPGHPQSPRVSGAAFILCPPYLWLCQGGPGISPVTTARGKHSVVGTQPLDSQVAEEAFVCLHEERQQSLFSGPAPIPRAVIEAGMDSHVHTYLYPKYIHI